MSRYIQDYYPNYLDKAMPKITSFFIKKLSEKVKSLNLLLKSNKFTCLASVKSEDDDFNYNWDAVKLVNKTLNKIGIDAAQTSFIKESDADGTHSIYTYTWRLSPKKKVENLIY